MSGGGSAGRMQRDVQLVGSAGELERLAALSAAAIAAAPTTAAAFDRMVSTFVASTAAERARAMDDSPIATTNGADPGRRVPAVAAGRSRAVAVAGTALLVLTLLSAATAASPPLPARTDFDIDPTFATPIGAVAACICAVAAAAGAALPAWGSSATRDQTWKLLYAAAALLALGSAVGLTGIGGSVVVGTPLWTVWFAASALALASTIVGAEVRRRRVPLSEARSAAPLRDTDREYFTAIAERRRRAVADLDDLIASDQKRAALVDQRWRAAIDSARRDTVLSERTASSAKGMSAFRWRLEYAAEPDLDA